MEPGMAGAIAGTVVGVLGGAIGTYFSIHNAKSAKERRFVIRWALAFILGISLFLGGLFLTPASVRYLLWIPYGIVLTLAIRFCNTAHAKLQSDESAN